MRSHLNLVKCHGSERPGGVGEKAHQSGSRAGIALAEAKSLVPKIHTERLTIACNPSSWRPDALPGLRVPTCARPCHTDTNTHISKHKINL